MDGWTSYSQRSRTRHLGRDQARRERVAAAEAEYWARRHDLARQYLKDTAGPQVPAVAGSFRVNNPIDAFIAQRLEQKGVNAGALTDDHSFLRRLTLDTVGVVPKPSEIGAFFRDPPAKRRTRVIDRLLHDQRWADHWVGYWQDVLAENPALVHPTLNNTGPFRWWIYQSLKLNKPMDRFVTELVMMEGSTYGGAPAGFSVATMNDVPMAAKAQILSKAFLGIDMACARCHDAPIRPYKQRQLFGFAALLERSPLKVPSTSSVDFAGRARRPRVEVSLKPGTAVEPAWPFPDLAGAELPSTLLRDPADTREHLAAILTSPRNQRFSQVLVNRLWKRYLGWGLVEPVDDWLKPQVSHPELLDFLSRELVTNDYDLKHVARLILTSHTYQRTIQPGPPRAPAPSDRLFASPRRRRMSAEQVVDSLFLLAGREFLTEAMDFAPLGRRPRTQLVNLGTPSRAWGFVDLSNARDRPSVSLPYAQDIVDVLTIFGWRGSRQNPLTERDETATVLQPMTLANGNMGRRITTLSDENGFTQLSLAELPLSELIEAAFLRILSRPPTDRESADFVDLLDEGYDSRRILGADENPPRSIPITGVSWENHSDPRSARIKIDVEQQANEPDTPTRRLEASWRERMEDMVWCLVNSPEFLFLP